MENIISQDKTRIGIFDLYRILFAAGVIIGHIYCVIYQQGYVQKHGMEWTSVHNIFTDGFFLISGFLIPFSLDKKKKCLGGGRDRLWMEYQTGRIKRLLGPLLFSMAVSCLTEYGRKCVVSGFVPQVYFFGRYWPSFLMISSINGVPGHGVNWYVSALFWGGFILSSLVIYREGMAKRILLPIFVFMSYTYLYTVWGNDNLGNQPMIGGFFSVGLIRALCVMAMGMECYYVSGYLKKRYRISREGFAKSCIFFLEAGCMLTLFYCATRKGMESTCFLIYPAFGGLCMLFGLEAQILHKAFEIQPVRKIISVMARYTYMIYLTHTILLENIVFFWGDRLRKEKPAFVFAGLFLLSLLAGIMLFHVEKRLERWVEKGLKRIFIVKGSEEEK